MNQTLYDGGVPSAAGMLAIKPHLLHAPATFKPKRLGHYSHGQGPRLPGNLRHYRRCA
jgi:hypothetical protein